MGKKYYREEGSSVQACFQTLRQKVYKIYGTSPAPQSISIYDSESSGKLALVFGNEHEGISEEVKSNCDGLVHIPMLGFTESFNISVAASILLFDLTQKAGKYHHPDFHLSNEEKKELRMKWYRSVLKKLRLAREVYQKRLK